MPLLGYDSAGRFALADEPEFPEETAIDKSVIHATREIVLREWCSYWLKTYEDTPEFMRHAPVSQFLESQWPNGIYQINFRNYVGLSRFGNLRLRIENRKIGDKLFHRLLDDIAARYADLIFAYSDSPVGHGYERPGDPGRNLLYVEYLFLRRYLLVEDIGGMISAIVRNPHYRMMRDRCMVPVDKAHSVEPSALLESMSHAERLSRLESNHSLNATCLAKGLLARSGKHLFPTAIPEERRFHSFDTHENRFIKHLLEEVSRRLDTVRIALKSNRGGLLNPSIGDNLNALQSRVDACLDDPFWREVGRLRLIPAHSPVLQRREGYRQLFRLYALLHLLSRYDYALLDFENLIETKNTADLYEFWCFFQLKDLLDTRYPPIKTTPLVSSSDTQQKLVQGVCVEYPDDLVLSFNWIATSSSGLHRTDGVGPPFDVGDSYSKGFRPDFVVSRRGRRLLLDAKNKGQRGSEPYGEENDGKICSPKVEDLVKMHAYRDAIQDVWGAFVLFPGTEARVYPCHGACARWEGVGALALRPGSDAQADGEQLQCVRALFDAFCELPY